MTSQALVAEPPLGYGRALYMSKGYLNVRIRTAEVVGSLTKWLPSLHEALYCSTKQFHAGPIKLLEMPVAPESFGGYEIKQCREVCVSQEALPAAMERLVHEAAGALWSVHPASTASAYLDAVTLIDPYTGLKVQAQLWPSGWVELIATVVVAPQRGLMVDGRILGDLQRSSRREPSELKRLIDCGEAQVIWDEAYEAARRDFNRMKAQEVANSIQTVTQAILEDGRTAQLTDSQARRLGYLEPSVKEN